jgi:hypothetical protein
MICISETAGGLRDSEYVNYTTNYLVSRLERSLTGDFRLQVFFHGQFLPGADIRELISGVNDTGDKREIWRYKFFVIF